MPANKYRGIPRRAIFLAMALLHTLSVLALMLAPTASPTPPTESLMLASWLPAPVTAAPTPTKPVHQPPKRTQPVRHHSKPLPPTPLLAATQASSPAMSTAAASNSSDAQGHEAATLLPAAAPVSAPATPSPASFNADYLSNPAPEYPRLSRQLGEEGRVELRVHVTSKGLPDEVDLHRSSGYERLDKAAQQAVWRWKFVPARLGQEAQPGWVIVPISFNLRK